MATIPENKIWSGIHPGNYSGNLWSSWNIDLEKSPGRIVLSDKLRRFKDGVGVVTKFIRTNATTTDQWFGITSGDIIRNGNSTITAGTFTSDDTSGTFNDPLDMELHETANGEQRLICTRDTDVAILNSVGVANAWDADWYTAILSGSALVSGDFHPIARLQRLIAIGDKPAGVPVIHTIDSADTLTESKLSFHSDFSVRVIYASSNRFWIGLQNNADGNAKIIEWDGFSASYNNEYDLEGSIPLTGFIVNDIPYFITEKGYIFKWSGGGFVKVQSFNLDENRMVFSSTLSKEDTIKPYGVFVEGNIVYINVGIPMIQSNEVDDTILTRGVRKARSGIWIFNTVTGNLYHHMGIGEHASAGTDVNYGCGQVDEPGIVITSTVGEDKILIATGSVFTGGTDWKQAGGTNGIYRMIKNNEQASNAGRNRGYFVTSFIPIKEIGAMWQALWVKFKRFVNSNNRIIVKWRTLDPLFNASAQDQNANPNEFFSAEGDWQSTTTFNCVVPTGVSVGDEVEVLTGDNAGCSFNISILSATPDNSSTILVTIDEIAPTSSTDTFLCRFTNWNTETAISSTTVGNQKIAFTGSTNSNHGEFVQLKIEMRGFEVEIDELQPVIKGLTNNKQG